MELLASSYGYQIMDHSWHTVTKYSYDGKNHSARGFELSKGLKHITDQIHQDELVKPEMNIGNQLLLDCLFCGTLNFDCWNFKSIYSHDFVTAKNWRGLKWILIPSP